MGQYYKPLLIHEDGTERAAYSHAFDNGLKLMEHSWIGNNFVNAVLNEIKDNPTRLAWLGDYSDSAVVNKCNLGDGFITSASEFQKRYRSVWGDESDGIYVSYIDPDEPQFHLDMDHTECYLVNCTKQCYVDMEQYVKQNSLGRRYGSSELWCINPLPLLTCVGNGLGGGDYRGEKGINDVGSWAFDKVYITYLRPGKWTEVMYSFQEQ